MEITRRSSPPMTRHAATRIRPRGAFGSRVQRLCSQGSGQDRVRGATRLILLEAPRRQEHSAMRGASDEIVAWTVKVGLDGLEAADLMAGYCERLVDAGVPLWRASIGADTLHPLNVAQGHRWLAGEGVREEFYARATTP